MFQQITFILAFTITSFLFHYFPQIDILVSSLFYNSEQGFYLKPHPIAIFFHRGVPILCACAALVVGFLALKKFLATRSLRPKTYIKFIYFILVCLLGAGFVVHTVVKDNFNRSRPKSVYEFGGEHTFTPAFVVGNQCQSNCSFVSGHAAAGFMFFGLAFLYNDKKRKRVYTVLGLAMGSLFGAERIIEGAHYLSDVVFAGFVMYMVAYALAKILKPAG